MRKGGWRIVLRQKFFAAHSCSGFNGPEISLHGHTFEATVVLEADSLLDTGEVIRTRDGVRLMNVVLAELMHADLNEVREFKSVNSTPELLARMIFDRVNDVLGVNSLRNGLCVKRVSVSDGETETEYWQEEE